MCKIRTVLCTDAAQKGALLLRTLVLCLLISKVQGGISPSQSQTDLLASFRHQSTVSRDSAPGAEGEEIPSDPNSTAAEPNTPAAEEGPADPNTMAADPNVQAAEKQEVATDLSIALGDPELWPDPPLRLLALIFRPLSQTQQLLSLTHLSVISANQILKVVDPSVAEAADPNVSAAKDEEVPTDLNITDADPNMPATDDKEIPSDPETAAAEPNAPAAGDEEGPADPDITAAEPNTPVAKVNEGPSDPNAMGSDPNVPAAQPDMPASKPNTYYVEQFLESGPTEEDTSGRMTELVGFLVLGRLISERLAIDDMDSIVTSDGQRLLPLLRVLRAFGTKIEDQGTTMSFTPEGVGPITIDFEKKQIQGRGVTRPLDYLEATSEITLKPDIYISPEDLGEILDMELQWDNEIYEYRIQLDRTLNIWKRELLSLAGIDTELLTVDLPEKLPAADRSEDFLHLAEFTWPSSYTWRSPADRKDSHVATLSSPRETFWGNFQEGQYKAQISNPGLRWENDGKGLDWNNDDSYVAKVNLFEWVYRLPSSEVALGDSAFGLGELVLPGSEMTGIRFNGLNGFSGDELKADKSSLGLNQVFGKPYVSEGYAPLGATVQLLVNDKEVQTQDVFPEEHLPPGIGKYRFEEIQLSSGIVNEITVVITEPNGNEIRVEKSVRGAPPLLPKGRNAYLGVLGSTRDLDVDDNRNIEFGDFYGQIGGGRVLYGLSDRLTIGGMLGFQHDHFHRYLKNSSASGSRSYPESSLHAGGMFSYLPFNKLFVSGDFGASHGRGEGRYNDVAGRMRAEYLATERLSFSADLLNLGSDYFDGENPKVSDRRGGELGMSWRYGRNWTLTGGVGQLRNNLDGQLGETLIADYQSIGLRTAALPRTSLDFKLDRLNSNLATGASTLGKVTARISLPKGLNVFGQIAAGDELDLGEHDNFFSGLKLRNAPWIASPSQSFGIRKSLTNDSAVTLAYSDAEVRSVVRLIHDLNIKLKEQPLRVRMEVLHDLSTEIEEEKYGFRAGTSYLLDSTGYNRLGVAGEYLNGEYRLGANLAIRNLYASHKGRLSNVNEQRIVPAYGAVHGKVFLDYDGDVILDPDEPGVPDIKVFLGRTRATVTNEDGYYILPSVRDSPARVYLDIDTVPAIYNVTHGTQLANIVRDSLTEVNLSLAPFVSVSGRIVITEPDGTITPISGARVYLTDVETNRLVADSVTAGDGSYYIGDMESGDYILQVDEETVSPKYSLSEQKRTIKIVPTKEEFLEIEQPDFTASVIEETEEKEEKEEQNPRQP